MSDERKRLLTLDQARAALCAGRLLIFPTETVYGLGCDALNAEAVAAVFALKQRSPAMPLPVVIGEAGQLERLAYKPGRAAAALMRAFWPGPLSLLLPARRELPDLLTGGTGKIAVRFSPHPAVQALCAALDGPLVATSANISGEPSASVVDDVSPLLLAGAAGVYRQGEEPGGGPPSTLAEALDDMGGDKGPGRARLLREGAISEAALRAAGFSVVRSRYKSPIKK